jgi:hypothetical protein
VNPHCHRLPFFVTMSSGFDHVAVEYHSQDPLSVGLELLNWIQAPAEAAEDAKAGRGWYAEGRSSRPASGASSPAHATHAPTLKLTQCIRPSSEGDKTRRGRAIGRRTSRPARHIADIITYVRGGIGVSLCHNPAEQGNASFLLSVRLGAEPGASRVSQLHWNATGSYGCMPAG